MIKRILNYYRRNFWSCDRYGRSIGANIGNDCPIATRNFDSAPYLITIGDHVQITHGVNFFCHRSAWVFREKKSYFDFLGKIRIGNNVIFGEGAVLTKSMQSNCIVACNLARIIGSVNKLEDKVLKYNVSSIGMSYDKKKKLLLSLPDDKFVKKQ